MMHIILHCDINCCFANIEMALNPALRSRPLAVTGDPQSRRGIVLAKSESAKRCGVSTGDTLWQAKQKCPDLQCVLPHFDIYECYSRNIRRYYAQFSPQVEPFGLDECWLDVTGSGDFAWAEGLADKIRNDVRRIFGITVSVGVSFSKILAKLGSDMRKPDATTVIHPQTFRQQIWPLPIASIIGIGRASAAKLHSCGIHTIGAFARSDLKFIRQILGINGERLWMAANGADGDPVLKIGEWAERQSLGHGTTLPKDVSAIADLWPVIQNLSENIAFGLQRENFKTHEIQVIIRDSQLQFRAFHRRLPLPVSSSRAIADYALMIISQNYTWDFPVRAITIRTSKLSKNDTPHQLQLFPCCQDSELIKSWQQASAIDIVVQKIQDRFGKKAICRGAQITPIQTQPGFFPSASANI